MIGRLHRDERGAQYVEYLAGLLLVAVAGLGGWRAFGEELGSTTGDGERAVRTMAGRSPGAAGGDVPAIAPRPPPAPAPAALQAAAPARPRFVPPPEWAVPYEEPFLGVDWDTFWSESWRRTKNLAAGDFNEDQDGADITAQVFLGLTPAGVVADVRDIGANAAGVWQGRDGAWIGLGAASVGLIPGLGDGLKPLIKGGRRLAAEGVEATVDVARRGGTEIGDDAIDAARRELAPPPLPAAPSAAIVRRAATGLGEVVDDIVAESPALTRALDDALQTGRVQRIQVGPPGGGSYLDRATGTITLDESLSAADQARVLSHEVGHARHTVPEFVRPTPGMTRDEFIRRNVQRHLDDEGEAVLSELDFVDDVNPGRVRAGQPPIEVRVTRPPQARAYRNVYRQYKRGLITRDEARRRIGNVMGNHEITSTTGGGYRDYYAKTYADWWDQYVVPPTVGRTPATTAPAPLPPGPPE